MGDNLVARVVVALTVAVGLAVIGAHPRVQHFERRFGLSVLASAGLPLLLLGYFFRRFGVLPVNTLTDLRPIWEFALGWVGLVVGMQVNLRRLDRLPPSFLPTVWLVSLPPTLMAALACSLALWAVDVVPGAGFVRDALILMACAAVSAPANLELLLRHSPQQTKNLVTAVTQLDQGAAFGILALVAVVFRPPRSAALWSLPRSGWFLVMVGLGFIFGVILYLLIRRVHNRTEEVALVLGGIALAAGTAGYLALSVPVVCALAGVILANAPYRDRERLEVALAGAERSIYLILLFVVGAWWRPLEWQGWLIGVVFALSRGYGKLLGARIATRLAPTILPPANTLALALLPQSAVAIVVIFSLAMLHGLETTKEVRWAITAVIVGSILTEIFIQAAQRRIARNAGDDTARTVSQFP